MTGWQIVEEIKEYKSSRKAHLVCFFHYSLFKDLFVWTSYFIEMEKLAGRGSEERFRILSSTLA